MLRKKFLLGGMMLALCCIATGAAVYVPAYAVPPISEQLPENYSRLYVRIVSPFRESRWPLNSFVPILVQAQAAEPIQEVELFINGKPLQPQSGVGDSFSHIWMWQPGLAGDFMLTARATGRSGLTGVSAPLLIHAMAAGNTVSPVEVKEGDTLQSIAEKNGIALEQMEESNPGLGASQSLQGAKQVMIPNAPAPVTNHQVIEPLSKGGSQSNVGASSSGGSSQSGGNEQTSGSGSNGSKLIGPSANFWNNLNFLLESNPPVKSGSQSGPKYPPSQPGLLGDFKGCDINLRFSKMPFEDAGPHYIGWEDDGFFVYRSRDGGPSERIATLPPIHAATPAGMVEFSDTGEYGTLTYYVSAFNTLGEVASAPLTFSLNPGVCPPSGAGGENGIRMDADGNIILPFQMDMAYLYVQINGSGAVRVPEGSRMFLPGSGIRFNLYDYLSTLSDAVQAPDLKLHMEVWGWQGGNLVFAGTFDTELHRTVLSICSVPGEGSCSSGGGQWVSTVTLPHDPALQELKYEMRWQVTSLTAADNLVLSVSENPLPVDFGSQGLLYHSSLKNWVVNGNYLNTKGNDGIFPLDLGNILYPNPPPSQLGWDPTPSRLLEYRSTGFADRPAGQPFTLYVHVFANLGLEGYEHESNIVTLLYDTTAQPVNMPPLESPYPSLYTLDILEDQFKPASHYKQEPIGSDLWGCVIIDDDPTGQYTVGQLVCPPVAPNDYDEWFAVDDPCGDILGWFENCVLGGIEAAYTTIKDALVEGLTTIIPGCSDSTDCQDIVRAAVKYGAAYVTGLPPDLPSVDDLISGEISNAVIDFATGGVSSATGLDESMLGDFCDSVVDCQGKLSEPIKAQLKQARSTASQKACTDPIGAYEHDVELFCLDPSIVVHPAPGSIESPAVALVRVTRNNTPAVDTGQVVNDLSLTVSADSAGSPSNHVEEFLKPARVSIPALNPGESTVVPVRLESKWLETGYAGGTAHVNAAELCYSPGSTWDWVPCKNGGTDAADITIP